MLVFVPVSRRLLWMTTVALRIFSVSLIRNPLKRNRFFLLHHISLILSHDVALISSKTRIGKPYRRLLKVFFHLSSKTIRLHVLVPTYGKLSLELFLFRETKGYSIPMWIILNCGEKYGEGGGDVCLWLRWSLWHFPTLVLALFLFFLFFLIRGTIPWILSFLSPL